MSNRSNKAKFIELLSEKLKEAGIQVLQSEGDADHLIAFTALTAASLTNDPVVLVGTDTDLLAQLVAESTVTQNLFMRFDPANTYKIEKIKSNLPSSVLRHLLVAHAITGCDTVSALYQKGKKPVVTVLSKTEDFSYLDVFKNAQATHSDVTKAGEKLLLSIYGAKSSTETLNEQRYVMYHQQAKTTLTSSEGLQLKYLPPTSNAAAFHSYRAYLQVQQWLGNDDIQPTDWGWRKEEDILVPIEMDSEIAPERVLRLLSVVDVRKDAHADANAEVLG